MVRFSRPCITRLDHGAVVAVLHLLGSRIGVASAAFVVALTGCGGGAFVAPPINLSVSVNNTTVVVPPNGTAVNVAVTIVAPTETASFTISGLPAGVSESYKESESNPSGLLTLVANSMTVPGTYMPKITVGSSGQTASVIFTLVISTPPKASQREKHDGSPGTTSGDGSNRPVRPSRPTRFSLKPPGVLRDHLPGTE